MKIILASASPRRAELLRQIGITYQQVSVNIDETVKSGEKPLEYVNRMAREKVAAGVELVAEQNIHLPVLAADTIVELDGHILGKPVDAEHAVDMLGQLSGRTHRVHTAISLVCEGRQTASLSSSEVEFAALTSSQIADYVVSAEPLDKAGAYAIQGAGGQFVKSLKGSYSGVMGLPLYEVAQLLQSCELYRST